jgi:hypothetical protein
MTAIVSNGSTRSTELKKLAFIASAQQKKTSWDGVDFDENRYRSIRLSGGTGLRIADILKVHYYNNIEYDHLQIDFHFSLS